MARVEFVNYTGEYPCLCFGEVTLKIDGKIVEFARYKLDSVKTGKPYLELSSGGSTGFTDDWDDIITRGEWSIELDPQYAELKEEILKVVNDNIPYGCCGGCI